MRTLKLATALVSAFLGTVALGIVAASSAFAGDVAKPCDDARILKSVASRFYRQSETVHHQKLSIAEISNVHEHRAYAKSEFKHFARRYCGATVTLSDGRRRDVWYLIESNAGFAGLGNNVEFCVAGRDRWNVYDASCRVLR